MLSLLGHLKTKVHLRDTMHQKQAASGSALKFFLGFIV